MTHRTSIRELAAHELDHVTGAAMLVASFDDGDWCGTRVPGKLPIPIKHELAMSLTLPALSLPGLARPAFGG